MPDGFSFLRVDHGGVADLEVFLGHFQLPLSGFGHIVGDACIVFGQPCAEVGLYHAGDQLLFGLRDFQINDGALHVHLFERGQFIERKYRLVQTDGQAGWMRAAIHGFGFAPKLFAGVVHAAREGDGRQYGGAHLGFLGIQYVILRRTGEIRRVVALCVLIRLP